MWDGKMTVVEVTISIEDSQSPRETVSNFCRQIFTPTMYQNNSCTHDFQ